jgi:hypothetical protein
MFALQVSEVSASSGECPGLKGSEDAIITSACHLQELPNKAWGDVVCQMSADGKEIPGATFKKEQSRTLLKKKERAAKTGRKESSEPKEGKVSTKDCRSQMGGAVSSPTPQAACEGGLVGAEGQEPVPASQGSLEWILQQGRPDGQMPTSFLQPSLLAPAAQDIVKVVAKEALEEGGLLAEQVPRAEGEEDNMAHCIFA